YQLALAPLSADVATLQFQSRGLPATLSASISNSSKLLPTQLYRWLVRAVNCANLSSLASSSTFLVDSSAPLCTVASALHKVLLPAGYQNQNTFPQQVQGAGLLLSNALCSDDESGIDRFQVSVSAGGVVLARRSFNVESSMLFSNLTLTNN